MFTQTHYLHLADMIKAQRISIDQRKHCGVLDDDQAECMHDAMNELQHQMILHFKTDNPKFKEFLFIEACSNANELSSESASVR